MIKHTLVKIKEHPPYIGDMENKVLLNSMARATFDVKTGSYSFKGKLPNAVHVDTANVNAITDIVAAGGIGESSAETFVGVGVDQGPFESLICV